MKFILFIKRVLCYSIGFVILVCSLSLLGGPISQSIITDIVNSNSRVLFGNNIKHKFFSGFEDDFLEYTDETQIPQIHLLDNSQTNQKEDVVAVNLSALSGKYGVTDGKAVINNTNYDVSTLINDSYSIPEIDKNQPAVLIYHTHTSESYDGGGTVVDVGNRMCDEFEKAGFKTIHITDTFDKEQFSGAYSRSIIEVEKVLKKYPSIKFVFDVHRDSIADSEGTAYRPLSVVNDEQTAQVMFVCGTDQKGLSHPYWKENFKFALAVSKTLGSEYNGLSRPVNLRADRFNTHVTKHTFLIEMGSEKNTLAEVERAAVYTVDSIIKTIEKSE